MEEKVQTLGILKVPHFCVCLDEVRLRTGRISRRLKIEHPKAVAVVPRLDDKHILMVRQYRYAVQKETLEVPAGKVDSGETIEEAVSRELLEETGYRAGHIFRLISYYPAIAYSNEVIEIFVADNLEKVSSVRDTDEISGVEVVTIEEALRMIKDGVIRDGKTIISLLLFRDFIK